MGEKAWSPRGCRGEAGVGVRKRPVPLPYLLEEGTSWGSACEEGLWGGGSLVCSRVLGNT